MAPVLTTDAKPASRAPARGGLWRAATRLRGNEGGATTVEFALIALPFFALLFAILETALAFFAANTLETAVTNASRLIRTGQAQANGLDTASFKADICGQLVYMFSCSSSLYVDVTTYTDFASISLTPPLDANGNLKTTGYSYTPGHGSDIVVVRAYYEWPVFVPHIGNDLSDLGDGKHLLAAAAAFRNEPFMVSQAMRGLRRSLKLARDQRGVSAVEFALILPIMLSLYLGGDELGNGLTISRKVTHVSSSLSDLITQSTTISNTDMTNILNAAASVIQPYSTSKLTIKLSEYYIDANKHVTVQWSSGFNTTGLSSGTVITNLPASLLIASTYLVTAEVHYSYKPTVGYIMTGTFDLHDQLYLRPRLSDSGITRTTS